MSILELKKGVEQPWTIERAKFIGYLEITLKSENLQSLRSEIEQLKRAKQKSPRKTQ